MALDYRISARVSLQDRFSRGSNTAASSAKRLGAAVGAAGSAVVLLKRGFDEVSAALTGFGQFEGAMSELRAITGSTDSQLRQLSDTALSLAQGTKFRPEEVTQAMKFLGLAGFNTNQILSSTPALLDLAAASGGDLATTADVLSDNLSALGLAAEDAGTLADIFARTATSTNTNVLQLGEALTYAGSTARNFGLDAAQAAAAIGIMSDNGVKASRAGTALRGVISRLIKPSREAAGELRSLGVSIDDGGEIKDFQVIIADLQRGLGRLSEARRQEAISTIFGQEAQSGANALINTNIDRLNELVSSLRNSEGAAGEMANTMQNNFQGAVARAQSAVDVFRVQFGATFGDSARNFLDDFAEDLNKNSSDMIDDLGGVSAALNTLFEGFSELILQKNKTNTFLDEVGTSFDSFAERVRLSAERLDEFFARFRPQFLVEGQETVSQNLQTPSQREQRQQQRIQNRRTEDVLRFGTQSQRDELIESLGGIESAIQSLTENQFISQEAVQNLNQGPRDISGARERQLREVVDQALSFNVNVGGVNLDATMDTITRPETVNALGNIIIEEIIREVRNSTPRTVLE